VAARNSGTTRVYLEQGKTWVFACAVDWPGWCRRGKGDEGALEALTSYVDRYRLVAGAEWDPGELEVIGRVTGSTTTDFGAPDATGPWDDEPLTGAEAQRLTGLLEASWQRFDDVVHGAPAALRKGPRGGGRDRDAVVDHVREAERSYTRKVGPRVPPRTPWPEQRAALAAALRAGAPDARWPTRYAVRRIAWHVLDHAWEIEDKS
jgi:hypothetical protein